MCSVFGVFEHRKEKTYVKHKKNLGDVFCQIFNHGVFLGLPVEINNPVPASLVRFQQFRIIERFCVEGSNKRIDRGALQ